MKVVILASLKCFSLLYFADSSQTQQKNEVSIVLFFTKIPTGMSKRSLYYGTEWYNGINHAAVRSRKEGWNFVIEGSKENDHSSWRVVVEDFTSCNKTEDYKHIYSGH